MTILKTYPKIEANALRLNIEIANSGSIEGFSGFTLGEELVIRGESIIDETLLDSVIDNHIASTFAEAEDLRNTAKEKDGLAAYKKTQIALREARLFAPIVISDEVYDEFVYFPMDKTINSVRTGNWLSAKNALALVQPNEYLTEAMILSFKNQIANYIVYSGNYIEYTGKTIDPTTGLIS